MLPTGEALRKAQEQGLNLVEVAPNVRPPVCKILDYGKYKYDIKQDAKRKKKKQVTIEVKEVKFRPKVDKHDFDFKVRHVFRFLGGANKVKCTIMFRGREMAHTEIGEQVLTRVLDQLEGKVHVEARPKLEHRNMSMIIAPKSGAFPKPEKQEAAPAKKSAQKERDRQAEEEAADIAAFEAAQAAEEAEVAEGDAADEAEEAAQKGEQPSESSDDAEVPATA